MFNRLFGQKPAAASTPITTKEASPTDKPNDNNNRKGILRVSYGASTTLSEKKEIECVFNNFESLKDKDKRCGTPIFECHGHKWTLGIYPWGNSEEAKKKEMVSVFLNMKSIVQPTKVKFFLEIAGTFGTLDETFEKGPDDGWGWNEFMPRSKALKGLDKSGALICNVTIQGWFLSIPEWCPENPLMDKMRKLYNSEDESDVSFVFQDGKSVRANSHVLAIQCPALFKIVQQKADDKITKVEFDNVDADLFGLMLRFMYYQDLPSSLLDLKEKGVDLLKMADRFEYPDLKMRIEADLVNSRMLKTDNAAEFLVLADALSCALLKEAAIEFIIESFATVMKTEGWTVLAQSAALLNELLRIKYGVDNGARGEKVSTLRKRLADQGQDVDGTKEMLVNSLKKD